MRSRTVCRALVTTLVLGVTFPAASLAMPGLQEEQAVLAVVQQAFDAMAADDAGALSAVLLPTGSAHSVRGAGEVRSRSFSEWIADTGSGQQRLLERMWEPTVMIAGDTAVVWTPYDFWIDGAFSHCGTDVFSLLRVQGAWKIATVTYDVIREGCAPSPLGPPR